MTQPYIERSIPLSQLSPSATQPRKNFQREPLAELAESLKSIGLLNPLSVRKKRGLFAEQPGSEIYEIVCGERRFRAAALAEFKEVTCRVYEWSDQEAIEAQWIENLQRVNLDPIEESEGFEVMLEMRDAAGNRVNSVETVAAKCKRHPTYVYQRLNLHKLPPMAREALLNERIGIRHGRVLARIPNEAQREEAAARIIQPDFQEAPLTTRQAEELIKRDYMRSLKSAPFDTDDASLFPSMGACGPCPFRTGNANLGMDKEMSGHLCTNPECFRLKTENTWTRAQDAARAEGKRLLTVQESERLFQDNGTLVWTSGYIRLADQPTADLVRSTTKRLPTWKSLLKRSPAQVEICVARAPGGSVHEIALLQTALAAARAVEPDLFKGPRGEAPPATGRDYSLSDPAPEAYDSSARTAAVEKARAEETRKLAAQRLQTRIDLAVLRETMTHLVKEIDSDGEEPAPCYWTAMLPLVLQHAGEEARSFIANRRGIDPAILSGPALEVAETLSLEISSFEMPGLFAELLLSQFIRWQGGEKSPFLIPLLNAFEIDAAAIRERVDAESREAIEKSKSPKKEKATGPTAP